MIGESQYISLSSFSAPSALSAVPKKSGDSFQPFSNKIPNNSITVGAK